MISHEKNAVQKTLPRVCIFILSVIQYTNNSLQFVSCRLDTNECAVDSTLCGDSGTCQNTDNGNFYSCDCNNGFEENGASASDGSLTCVGRFLL